MSPIWLSVAGMCLGIREIPGPQSAQVIIRWARDIGAPKWYENDDQAWCAVFMNRLMSACQLPMAGTGFELLRARTFEGWGQTCGPALGAIMVFNRPEGAHVGLYLGEYLDTYRVRGGNQSNAVTDTWIAKSRLTAFRWPAGVPMPSIGPVRLQASGVIAVSEDET